jgi:transposase
MISYKSMWAGRTYHKIDRWFPSSKTCSSCDFKLDNLNLNTRSWSCPSCGVEHDRDINAANNILHKGHNDCYGYTSHATGEVGFIPMALQKFTVKIERSGINISVSDGSKQALSL